MRFHNTPLAELYLVELEPRCDARGFFARAWCARELAAIGLNSHCEQANLSFNHLRGTLRGMHYQEKPHGEAKFVRVVRGAVHDVVLDLRRESRTFGQWFAQELSAENRLALSIPAGCAHGYLTLVDNSEVFYLVSVPYCAEASRGIRWDCPALRGAWPFPPQVVSPQDETWPGALPASAARLAIPVTPPLTPPIISLNHSHD